MKLSWKFPDVVAGVTIMVAIVFLGFNIWLSIRSESIFRLSLPNGTFQTLADYGLLVALWISSIAYALMSITRRRFLARQTAINEKFMRDIHFQQSAINNHTITSTTDKNSVIIDVNDMFIDVFGYTRDEIIGQKASVLYKNKHLNEDFLDIGREVQDGHVWSGEQKMVSKTGGTIYVNATVIPKFDADGNHLSNLNIRTDMTASRLAEADRFLTMMLEDLQDEVYIFDIERLNIKYVNRTARDRCNWTKEEISDKWIGDSSPMFEERGFRHHVAPLISGKKQVVSVELINLNGPVEITTSIYAGLDDKKFFVSILRDISSRKEIEKARMESVSVVSHELRAPLTSIKGALSLLQSGVAGKLPPKAQPMIDIAIRNSDRLLLVVNDILDLEKIQAGKIGYCMGQIDLIALLTDAAEMNKGYADEYAVTFQVETSPENALIMGDEDRLMQVMTNLMSNAVKFSPLNGVVTLRVAPARGGWRVSVIDHGPGIPESARKTMFTPFTQCTPADGVERKGTGLGLTIAKTILRHHHSKIGFNSKIGAGTEFYFDIPAATQQNIHISAAQMSAAQ